MAPTFRTDDALRHRLTKPQGASDRQGKVADLHILRTIREFDALRNLLHQRFRQVGRQSNDGQIAERIEGKVLGRHRDRLAAGEDDSNAFAIPHDMVIREYDTF